ncbi:MAG: hypothetical protein Q8O59_04645 [bacterium]|nr:hypothetical protein [bacterium]
MYIAKDRALTQPAHGISIPHPVEIQKAGIEAFTSFTIDMPPDLFTEVNKDGVWQIDGYDSETGKRVVVGYGYWAGLNHAGDPLIQCYIAKRRVELENLRFLIYSRDAICAYQFDGEEAKEVLSEQEIKDGKKPLAYDAQKFDEDASYKKEFIAKFGQTLDKAIRVDEIIVGSPEWEKYCVEVNARFPEKYKMANGEIRIGSSSLDEFRWNAVQEPGFDGMSRFVDKLGIPLYFAPFASVAYPVILGSSLAVTAIQANADSPQGLFGIAEITRRDMAPTFRYLVSLYKKLVQFHIKRGEELERQIMMMRPIGIRSDLWLNKRY